MPCSSLQTKHARYFVGLFYKEISSPDDLPELGSDLVAALASLHVHDFSHGGGGFSVKLSKGMSE